MPTVRTDADAANLASEAQSRGLTVHPQRLDVRDVASIADAVSRFVAAHGRIDVSLTMPAWASPAPPSM